MIITNDLFYNPVKSDNSILKIFYFLLKEFSILKTIFLNVFLYILKKNHTYCVPVINNFSDPVLCCFFCILLLIMLFLPFSKTSF